MKRLFAVAVLCMALATPAMAGDIAGAKAFVNKVATDVLNIVKQPTSKELQQAELMGLIDARVDIDFVAKFALGKHWRTATEAQRADYLNAYRPFLKKNYVSRLTRYSGQTFKVGTGRVDSDGSYVVNMDIVDPQGANVVMVYRMVDAPKNGGYRISDIVVEGVSLLATQRSEFNSIVTSKGLDHLIAALKKQTARKA